jgi:predicted dithiol-disulfide oxidoreductase (DUF899 family)
MSVSKALWKVPAASLKAPLVINSAPALLHHDTPIKSWSKTPFASLETFKSLANYSWQYPYVQSFLVSFTTGVSIGMLELDKRVWGNEIRRDILTRVLR